jgi:Fe-S oxidoreductase
MDHLVQLTEEDAKRRKEILHKAFENFIMTGSTLLRLCPNCTFTVIHDYIKFLDAESNKTKETEH